MKKLMEFYDSVHMPEALEKKILNTAPAPRHKFRSSLAFAAALVVVLMLGCSPQVQELVKITFPDLGLTIYKKEATKPGEANGNIVHVNTELPTFARMEEGRLMFTGNGENLDITDQIEEEKPFFYTYEDEQGYTITLVVGYSGTIENFGTYTWIEKDGKLVTDAGRNIFSNTENREVHPWVASMWETLEIPWPMPGTPEAGEDIVVDIVLNEEA